MTADYFSNGGVVEKLEQAVARSLGKEMAVWMPTGTLANHMAVRLLAGEKRRVAVQAESHLFNDCGDCCQTLSGLHLVPLAPGRATFTVAELEREVQREESGRVRVPLGAIQIESPVRRRTGEVFEIGEMRRVSEWARAHGVGMHLDGARLYLGAAFTGVSVREYAALFDTVYVSMYKYFNAASGAVLAGPKALLEGLFHKRRMFGGGQHEAWPFAAVALHYFEGFEERMAKAARTAEAVVGMLEKDGRFGVERVKGGSNLFRVRGMNVDAARKVGLVLGGAGADGFVLVGVNETWGRVGAEEIVRRFGVALG